MARVIAALAVLFVAVVATGCSRTPSDHPGDVSGVIVVVTGESDLQSFVVLDGEGTNRLLVPGSGFDVTLDGMRDLLIAGEAVVVAFEESESGELVATSLTVSG